MTKKTWTLVVGTKTWSSWSLRAWLMMKQCAVPFTEEVVRLRLPDTAARLASVSPSGKVPVLRHGDRVIWESLAIAEYLAESFPDLALWPKTAAARAMARSAAAEMHAGFAALRDAMPMNFLARRGPAARDEKTAGDIRRIECLWRDCRRRHGGDGPFLFGDWTLADAMYAPVASRFVTYGVALAPESAAYVDAIMNEPAMKAWERDCRVEAPLLGEA